ncbi:alpha/beta hydrolase [Clostridium carnis]
MKHLPHSNGVYKVNMKRELKPKDIIKGIAISLIIILLVGFIYQRISNFIAKETLKPKVNYTRVDEKRLDYKMSGGGKYTIVFDGNIGANLNQWNKVVESLNVELNDVTTFVYNRKGYGYSDGGSKRTPKEQAMDLKILLRKAAAPPPYILVGEEYGSLVISNFVEAYPETVAGVVLVNPVVESEINSKEFKKDKRLEMVRRKVEKLGSEIGFTTILDKVNLDCKIYGFEDKIDDENILEEFNVHRTKSNYTEAVDNELSNLTSGENNSQYEGAFPGIPYYLVYKDGQESLINLGDKELTKCYKTTAESNFISIENPETIVTGIKQVIKQANDIEKKEKKQ